MSKLISAFVAQTRRPSFCPIDEKPNTENQAAETGKTAVVFTLNNEVGCLVRALRLFQVCHILISIIF